MVKGLVMQTASEKMQGLGKLLQAFNHKNPGTVIKVNRDGDYALQR
jgi:hypothetical protein